jgi:RNA polymerase sigma factor (sigma-70 family)
MRSSEPSDPELLAEWLDHQREPAFRSLVARYAGLVHMTARRTSGDDSIATEATQLTFIALAQKAKSLTTCATLGGWLHRTAMMQAKNLLRKSERENRKREQLAMEPHTPSHDETWREMQPVLDDALAALAEKDREALLLRFYRSLTIREIAETLGIATDAAQKRIDRATERLHGKLLRRGVQTGGSLSAAMLAGFAADAQAALPVSLLASKAIAAGAVSSFSLAAIITSITALMKSSSLIPPVVALLVAGAWTGTKYHFLSAAEARNELTRAEIADARSSMASTLVKLTTDDGPINWKRLENEEGNGPETQRFQKRLKSMAREELIAALDEIASFQVSESRRDQLERAVVMPLGRIDPEWVLNRFRDRLRDVYNELTLDLHPVFALWAQRDSAKATEWLDAGIAAGTFHSKRLDESTASHPQDPLESKLISVLLGSDPSAAARRLSLVPEKQKISVMGYLTGEMFMTPLAGGNHLAFANMVRSGMPPDVQTSILLLSGPNVRTENNFSRFTAYMEKIEATPSEKISCYEELSGTWIHRLSAERKVSVDDLEIMRGHFTEISPQSVDVMTARSLAMAMKRPFSQMRFPQASKIAVEYLETSGNDAVLTTLLEIADCDEGDKQLARELAGRILDETRRAEILKRFN